MERVRTSGNFLFEGEHKFFARGVAYGPFRPNHLGDPFPEKELVERDFALLEKLGANTLRVYHVPPQWLCQLAGEFGLRLLVGVPWTQHVRFLDSPAVPSVPSVRDDTRRRVREAAQQLAPFENVLGLLVGNEVSPQIVRWYGARRVARFLAGLADEARRVDPRLLVSYANFPMTEYLELDCVDFVSMNVYLHREDDLRRYLSRLQNLAGPRPLLLTEFGIDSLREGEQVQAEILARSARTAAALGLSGAVVFSYTDEWHTGGFEIEDWAFGLVTRERRPKPAYHALRRVFHEEVPPPLQPAPSVSVVVCAYNAARTLDACLASLTRLRYPDYEVIVVDDGSTDETRAIAERYRAFRLISHENRGLSVARNEGILAARGEVVAFTDSDCEVDPDWLTFLVDRLRSGDFAGVGGPNLPPPEDEWTAEVVARSPGGPTHVLRSDWEAEHVPGCNMAFWRRSLLQVGLFDPVFRTAGDDVDICWRLQDAGHTIGFAAAALVWHRRRHTVRNYLRQQRGYGRAEALLHFKHPYRFNGLGHSRWRGRIYGSPAACLLSTRPAIYGGPFGSWLFQTLYQAPSSVLRHLPSTLEWNAAAMLLLALGGLAQLAGRPLPSFGLAGLALLGISLAQALLTGLATDCRGLPRWRTRLLVAWLSHLGPLVRSIERARQRAAGLSRGLRASRPAVGSRAEIDLVRRRLSLSCWEETGVEKERCISALFRFLRLRRYHVVLDDGWRPWDLALHRGIWTRGEIRILVENHGGAKRQVDVGMDVRTTTLSKLVLGGCAGGALLATALGLPSVAAWLTAALLGTTALLVHDGRRLGGVFQDAVGSGLRPLMAASLDSGEGSS